MPPEKLHTCGINRNTVIPEAQEILSKVELSPREPARNVSDEEGRVHHLRGWGRVHEFGVLPPGTPEGWIFFH